MSCLVKDNLRLIPGVQVLGFRFRVFFCKKRVHPKDGSSGEKFRGCVPGRFWSQAGSGQIEKHVAGRLRDFVGRKFWEVPNTVAYKRTAQ